MHRNITFRRLVLDLYQFIRAQKAVTRLLGAQFTRSLKYAEIDITYRCNLRCNNCNRSCTQAPSSTDMPVEKIESFLKESSHRGVKWERIRLLGGEPTLHPQLITILARLSAYRSSNSPGMRIVICTNGSGNRVNEVLSKLPEDIVIKSTVKGSRQRLFRPFNRAPVDSIVGRFADFSSGCRIISDCGLGLTPHGYYPCAVAGGIDRVFGFGVGRKNLPSQDDDMRDLMAIFCRFCGHFGFMWPTKRQRNSPTWKVAYRMYAEKSVSRCAGSHV